jgi:Holliday junction resolvase RusA-like endonuclease
MTDANRFAGMSEQSIVHALRNLNVPLERAVEVAAREVGKGTQKPENQVPAALVSLPLFFTVPWSLLVSDNEHYSATIRNGKPLLVMGTRYREAKTKIRQLVGLVVGDASPTEELVAFAGVAWTPDRRRHDVANRSKLVLDALSKLVYQDDSQVHDVRWRLEGVDVDAPRAEIRISTFNLSSTDR